MLVKQTSDHIRRLAQKSQAVTKQFIPSKLEREFQSSNQSCNLDPLLEDIHEKTKGLIHKYPRRVLILLTLACASYCRFCTRRRKVSDIKQGKITQNDIRAMVWYIKSHPEINEVILSGGDPLVVPKKLSYALQVIPGLPQIKILRIGTRAPVSSPSLITPALLNLFKKIKQPLYIGIHFEHPDELTKETVAACVKLRQAGAILYSQSVFLKGINDDYETLHQLFSRLIEIGVKPYYIYRCDPVIGIDHFRVDFEKEIQIMTKLRQNLSGMACPTYVIDTPYGSGKIPVPLDFWKFDKNSFVDFLGHEKEVI